MPELTGRVIPARSHPLVVCLDVATHTGWAVWDGEVIESGVQSFAVGRDESPGMRFWRFNQWLRKTFPIGPGDLVLFEAAHHRGGAATAVCVGMVTRVIEWAAERGADHDSVPSGTLKKAVTGRGNAGKAEMMAAVSEHYGREIADDNEADALGILWWYQQGMPRGER